MKDDGYTLAETLVALATIGLAMGGLTAAVRVMGLNHAAATHSLAAGRDMKAIDSGLSGLLAHAGPFGDEASENLVGDQSSLSFDCHLAAACSAILSASNQRVYLKIHGPAGVSVLPLQGVHQAHFVYIGTRSMGSVWPSGSKDPDRLRAIELVGDGVRGTTALVTTPIWREQGSDCVFDPISGGCRKPTS